jgi:hypothetical protein
MRRATASAPAPARKSVCARTSGKPAHLWIIDVAGEQQVIAHALHTLVKAQFKKTPVRLAVQDAEGGARVEMLQSMLTPQGAGDGAS